MNYIKLMSFLILLSWGSLEIHAVTIERQINNGLDDAEEHRGFLKINSSDLELVEDKKRVQIVGMRFNNITIDKNQKIKRAYIQFTVDEISTGMADLKIIGEKSSNAKAFRSSKNNISSRKVTRVSVSWKPKEWKKKNAHGLDQKSSDITKIIQEIVNQRGWRNGNSMVMMIKGSGKRVAESYNGRAAAAPLLHIEYGSEGNNNGDTTPPTIKLRGKSLQYIKINSTYKERGARAKDNMDGTVKVVISGAVDVTKEGSYTITYSAEDHAGNRSILTRTVIVVAKGNGSKKDKIAPTISLVGETTINLQRNDTYKEEGALAIDAIDGKVKVRIKGNVNSKKVGTYTISYTAKDRAGNVAQIHRTVVVHGLPLGEMKVYEDAEDTTIKGWKIYDNTPSGATIVNEYDMDRGSRVIILSGARKSNAYELGSPSGTYAWNNRSDRVIQWSMKTKESFKVYVELLTTKGKRYISYTSGSKHGFNGKNRITIGLGSKYKKGNWQTITRDLNEDLNKYDRGNKIISLNGFRVYGSVRLDDIAVVKKESLNDNEPPIISINGSVVLSIALNTKYIDLGATANDKVNGKIKVDVVGTVDSSREGTYIITYNATDRANNTSSANRTINVSKSNLANIKLLLNEYNAVASNRKLKKSGRDSFFKRQKGNGNSWFEMVVVGPHVDIRGAKVIIKKAGETTFEGIIPNKTEFGHLRKGTIVTISNEKTDMSYSPFAPYGDDWNLNLNYKSLLNKNGQFTIDNNEITIEIIKNKKTIMAESGEGVVNIDIDKQEVFKLKRDLKLNITPIDDAYGDDYDEKVHSTFGAPNKWIDASGVLVTQSFNKLRVNRDLDEIGGIALSKIKGLVGLKDAESLLYVPSNNSLWISDDNAHKIYEMDLTTYKVKSIYTNRMLEEYSGVCRDKNNRRIQNCEGLTDLESIVYDDQNDLLYFYVGSAHSTPAIFRLTRDTLNDKFVLGDNDASTVDYRLLDYEYQAAQFIDQTIVARGYKLYVYDFDTNKRSDSIFETTNRQGKIYGMAYDGYGYGWIITSKNYLLKVNWFTKNVEAAYQMADKGSTKTYNGVYDTRGLEIIGGEIYILEGINNYGEKGAASAPYGHPLKSSVHIYRER